MLPSGGIRYVDRGAEQGDPLGPVYCALVLAKVLRRTRESLAARGVPIFDAWFLDDGQLVCRHSDTDTVLRTLDAEAARVGAVRATGKDSKSVARVVGSPTAMASCGDSWRTEYVHHSTTSDPARQQHVLGLDFGVEFSTAQQFRRTTDKVSALHEDLALVGDTACELILLRTCADVCKVVHLLRTAGPSIDVSALKAYDILLDKSLNRCLGGHLDEFSMLQASLGCSEGGLGMRRATASAAPAFVASRVESRWIASLLSSGIQDFVDPNVLLANYDDITAAAQALFEESLPPAAIAQARDLVAQAALERRTSLDALGLAKKRKETCIAGDGLVLPAGYEDAEFESNSLQHSLCALVDNERSISLLEKLGELPTQDRRRRLQDLRDPSVSHDWLWHLSPAHGPTVPRADFQTAVRLRLGAPCVEESTECGHCGACLGTTGAHAFCCSLAEATKGHYAVRDEILPLAHLADPSTTIETLGLIPSAPTLRPADILSSAALPGRLAALDIGVCCPDASGAGEDCCANMYDRKRKDYKPHLVELEVQQQISYRPMVWSTWGRAHPESLLILENLAMQAARRRGLRDHRLLLRRVRSAIGVQLMRRAVRMLHACLPRLEAAEMQLLLGDSEEANTLPEKRVVCCLQGNADCRP